jgi:Na+-transporting NADH:ubiquinone oxidoreductase subunit A
VVIELAAVDSEPDADAPQVDWSSHRTTDISGAKAEDLQALLLESGLWTALRTRPYGRIPKPGSAPQSIFVTALDTNPHGPDLDVVLEGQHEDLALGLLLLGKVGRGRTVRLCVGEGSPLSALDVEGVTVHPFAGPHPAGLPGVHINHLEPVSRDRLCWYVGVQDVAAMGYLFRTGKLLLRRTIALGGAPVAKPRLLRTRLGAAIGELLRGEVDGLDHRRVISGSVLHGHDATAGDLAFLGRYHQQVSVVSDERKRQFLGWMAPKLKETLHLDALLSKLVPKSRLSLNTQMHGERRPLIPIGRYERYLPHKDIVAPLLFRALLTKDLDKAEALGALELEEEDLALCSFVCPSKIHFGRHLREVLTELEKEGA